MSAYTANMQTVGNRQNCASFAATNVSRTHSVQPQANSSRDRCTAHQKAILRGADVCLQHSASRGCATQVKQQPRHACAVLLMYTSVWRGPGTRRRVRRII